MANYRKNREDKFLWELYCKYNGKKLELRRARRYKRDSREIREVEKRGRKED